jgi:periplasmic nitrate reductase NapD
MGHPARRRSEREMRDSQKTGDVNRRRFINGHWATRAVKQSPNTVEIASVLVQTRPERLETAARAIEALPGAQIYSRDPKGKLVVVIEAADTGSVGATLNVISSLPHVLTASLVFQGTDTG